ncbi:MAG TPA: chromosomal replication initiator protein DnaA, partial [Firmicutes bacterium]|nr:chromosomal replication initiator protein DnaA [Bacillota bacterium]
MVVVVNSGLAATLLATKYIDIISSVVRDVTESDFSLKFIQSSEIATITKQAEKKPTFFANSFINRKFTFDNFVVGTSNREASQAALMIASNPGKLYNYNPLFIFSHSGLGKTHLLHAIGNYIKDNTPALRVLYI